MDEPEGASYVDVGARIQGRAFGSDQNILEVKLGVSLDAQGQSSEGRAEGADDMINVRQFCKDPQQRQIRQVSAAGDLTNQVATNNSYHAGIPLWGGTSCPGSHGPARMFARRLAFY